MILLFLFHLQDGETPFMWACESSINRSAKVRYLGEKGADCRAKDDVRCCLFATYSTNKSPSFLFRKGRRLCFMPPHAQSAKMTWKMFFDILSLRNALISILLMRSHSYDILHFYLAILLLGGKDTLSVRM